jgi:hypothetical protein
MVILHLVSVLRIMSFFFMTIENIMSHFNKGCYSSSAIHLREHTIDAQ